MTSSLATVSRASLLLALPLVVGSLAAQAPAAPAQSAPPSDSLFAAVVHVIEDGDAAAREAFIARSFAASARAHDSANVATLLAKLHEGAPYEMYWRDVAGRNVFAKFRSRKVPRSVMLQVATDRDEPGKLAVIDVMESHASLLDDIEWPATRLTSDAALVALVRRNLDRLAAAGAFSGTVYIARHDSVLLARGWGLADREDSVPNGVGTRFAIASMGKMFTATAIMQLVDAGKLRLGDTLGRVLPMYPNADRASRITIAQLLQHSAGLGDQWSTPRKPVPGLTGALAYVGAVAWAPLRFEPGTRWGYSNEGYGVLAAVIEQVSGESFADYLKRHVFAPAGMTETVMEGGVDQIVPFRAVGYRPREDDPLGILPPRANWSFIGEGRMGGAGGGYSTVSDLARFGRALRAGKLVSAAARDSMWTGRWDIPGYVGERYGFGQFVSQLNGKTVVGHGGGGGGSGIDNGFRMATDGSFTVIVLTNIDPPAATSLTASLAKLLAAQEKGTTTATR